MACCLLCYGALLLAAVGAFKLLKAKLRPPRPSPIRTDWVKDRVYLYQFPRTRPLPNLSPFCLKLETWLRMAGIDYEVADCGFFTRSREGTVPFVELNGVEYPDSSLAIRDLTRVFNKDALDGHKDDSCRGVARAIQKLAENSLLQSYAYFRYVLPAGQVERQFEDDCIPGVPGWLRTVAGLAAPLLNRQAAKRSAAAGIGKHAPHEVESIGLDDVRALASCLGDKPYLLGEQPTTADATVFGVLAVIYWSPLHSPHKALLRTDQCANLRAFLERIKKQFWPDWDQVTGNSLKLNTDWRSMLKTD